MILPVPFGLGVSTVSHAYIIGSCNSYFLPPLLTLYKISLYIDVTYFKIGASTVPIFEFRGSNLLRDDKPQVDCLPGCGAPHVLGATPSIHCIYGLKCLRKCT